MDLMDLVRDGWKTCDILDQKDYGIVRVTTQEKADLLSKTLLLAAVGPTGLNVKADKIFLSDNHKWDWTVAHNESHKDYGPPGNIIAASAKLHDTCIIGMDGALEAQHNITKQYLHAKHLGCVQVGPATEIGAFTIIKRSLFPCRPTTIGRGTRILNHCNIGHNCRIGEDCLISVGVMINGSVWLGDRCTIWTGANIRNHVWICDDVVIGQGANVVSSIKEPGVYVGNPARRIIHKHIWVVR